MKPMLAKKYNGFDPTGWFMSEKLDGVRAIWDGENFISRNEKLFHAPSWFKQKMPKNYILDGELWIGRGRFNECSGQVRRKKNQNWSDITYMIFDIPTSKLTFKENQQILSTLRLPEQCNHLTQTIVIEPAHLKAVNEHILKLDGEGMMLRAPSSYYHEGKRSSSLIKVKRFSKDKAMITGYLPGKGKHINRVGALICDYLGSEIFLGTGLTDEERENPPGIGTVVKFSYFEMNNKNIPRFPVYKRSPK